MRRSTIIFASSDWNVERITVQTSSKYPSDGEFVKYKFKIKDKFGSNYSDYSNIIKVNWANYKESDGTQIQTIKNPSSQSISNIQGGNMK